MVTIFKIGYTSLPLQHHGNHFQNHGYTIATIATQLQHHCNPMATQLQPLFNHLHLVNSLLIIIIPKGIHWVQMGLQWGCKWLNKGCKWLNKG